MAKTKSDWLSEAHELGLKLTSRDKIADIKTAIEVATTRKSAPAEVVEKETTTVTKAGKHSAKAMREAEVEEDRQERITKEREGEIERIDPERAEEKRGPVPVPRPLGERRSRRYRELAKLVDSDSTYSLRDGVDLAVKTGKVKFDSSVELHVRLNVDPKQADQNVRGVVVLPNGTGKNIRVAVFAENDDQKRAISAGADIVGEEDFLDLLKKEELEFDVLVSTPQMMAQLGRYAKLLGPKGLMPNPKSGTVAKDVVKAVKQLKAGQLEYRVDDQGIIHAAAGKVSFGTDKLLENFKILLGSIKQSKPASVKGAFVDNIYMTTSMGPSISIDITDALSE